METETIDAIKEGTSQSINWKLFFFFTNNIIKKNEYLRNKNL